MRKPKLVNINANFKEMRGANDSSQKMWRELKRLFLVAICSFLKDLKCFCQKNGPLIFQKHKGCHLWDLDDKLNI